ncbi:MAG: triose-phosphate isomerase [Chitinophagaceae bacterium]
MRKQIAAANWKMNLAYKQAQALLDDIFQSDVEVHAHQQVIFAVPFPYLVMTTDAITETNNYAVAAQNCYHEVSGAYTGEVSADMLYSISIPYCIVGHSERREYFHETNDIIAKKIDLLQQENIIPLFCCGEPLEIREAGNQDQFVELQLKESLFHLSAEHIARIVIAYEPIWAIGTGKTASTAEAQQMHAHIRAVLATQFGNDLAENLSILYGGSVKPSNAKEIFSQKDVDGGLVGGASLMAQDFIQIIKALK